MVANLTPSNRKLSNRSSRVFSVTSSVYYSNRKFGLKSAFSFSNYFSVYYNNRKFNDASFPGVGLTSSFNPPPVLVIPLVDQSIFEGRPLNYVIANGSFVDPESEALTYTATLVGGASLPSWLNFNPTNQKFSGTPSHTDIGSLSIRVTAFDPFLFSAFDDFDIEIKEDLLAKTRDLFTTFRTLLPPGRAWNIDLSVNNKAFIDGIMDSAADVKNYHQEIAGDVFPDTTRSLELWEEQFALDSQGQTDTLRRDNLAVRWRAQGGQSVSYIESVIAALGINGKVYENFARDDPESFLIGGDAEILVNGDIISEEKALVNTCGDPQATCNDAQEVTCGEFDGFITTKKIFAVSIDSAKWIYYFIVADPASALTPLDIPIELKKSFELAILRVKPTHTRAVLNVNYI